ncbi:hypothetical protein [Tissierella creatinophila]|uniref:NlpC/P60 domain-containing protein n=1 Tax=Tissierella creatinophila DSM 6911 TaxID=1123403 RepID=A0A1U7M6I8_TISCR|nr:hypothetical protein [Tissierella creatinophila]OLS02870.1 hypothetical protein TICRE_11430 [Tissierella creatinophila DSM 6911]
MKTNIELVKFVEKALKENWGYCLGTYGQVLTDSLLKSKTIQGYGVGAYNTRHKAYLNKFKGKMVSDCYGLVKGFVWPKDSKGSAKYVASQDRNQEGAFNSAKIKGSISNIPNIPGLILWMKGHAGIYIGNGEFIECVGAPIGMRKGRIQNGKVVSGSKFTHWFKDTYITYVSETPNRNPSVNTLISSLKVGDKVILSNSAIKYATGQTIPSHIKNKAYTVQQVKSDRVLLKEIMSWVFTKDLGQTSPTKTLTVGSTVKIKGSKYSTGQNIPSWVKNKTHKVSQLNKDRVLISDINSWVNKNDVEVI